MQRINENLGAEEFHDTKYGDRWAKPNFYCFVLPVACTISISSYVRRYLINVFLSSALLFSCHRKTRSD